jgi:homeobox-leucine zipper protein
MTFLWQMNEEMHILSPLVWPREFNIICSCKQVDVGVWVIITDVSFDFSQPNTPPLSRSWGHPSGCIIREMPNKFCLVKTYMHTCETYNNRQCIKITL